MTKPTTVRFEEAEVLRLEELARRQKTSLSALIQRAVRTFYLQGGNRQAASEALLDYVERHPENGADLTLENIEEQIVEGMGSAATR